MRLSYRGDVDICISYSTSGGFFVIVKGEGAEIKESLEDTKKLLDEKYDKGEMTREMYVKAKKEIDETLENLEK